MTGKTLAAKLTAADITVTEVYEWTDVTDAGVSLVGGFDVQIAGNLLLLNRWDESGEVLHHLGAFPSVGNLIAAIRCQTTTAVSKKG